MADDSRDEDTTGEARAKEILEELDSRRPAGESITARVGRRRRSAPGSGRRARLFERMGLSNPWDADAKEDPPVTLGPVALKLTDRRQPAPHARPPSAKGAAKPARKPGLPTPKKQPSSSGKKKPPPGWKPPNLPSAKKKKAITATRPPTPEELRKLAAQKATLAPRAGPPAPAATAALPAQGTAKGTPKLEEEILDRSPPRFEPPGKKKRPTGRVRMAPRTIARAPVFRKHEKPPAAEPSSEAPAPPPEPAPPPRRSLPKANLGLDDLFGMGGGEKPTRMRLRRSVKKKEPGKDEG